MKKITYKEIAEKVGKTEGTIKNWKKNHTKLLEYVKIGATLEKNNITLKDVENCEKLINNVKINL